VMQVTSSAHAARLNMNNEDTKLLRYETYERRSRGRDLHRVAKTAGGLPSWTRRPAASPLRGTVDRRRQAGRCALDGLRLPHVPRYTYRRVSTLPVTDEGLRRYVELNGSDALSSVTIRHTVMQPGAELPVTAEDLGQLFITISGRGVMLLDGDRIVRAAFRRWAPRPGRTCWFSPADARQPVPTAHWLGPASAASTSASARSTNPRLASLMVR